MKTLSSDAAGDLTFTCTVFPGVKYSLYVRKDNLGAPVAGTLAFYHQGEELDPVITADGVDVTADLATADGLTAEFYAHGPAFLMSGSDLGDTKALRFSLIPVRS